MDSFIPFSIPFTNADMAMRLATPSMMPNIVKKERNLCAQISSRPTRMAFRSDKAWGYALVISSERPDFVSAQDC